MGAAGCILLIVCANVANLFLAESVLLSAFAFLSVTVAMVGVYGVMAYPVKRRTHEIGIRIAIGALRGDVLHMVVGEGLAMALTGVAIGVALSLALSRVLSAFLFGVGPRDMATFAAVCISLVIASGLASYLPARRATRVDPIRALPARVTWRSSHSARRIRPARGSRSRSLRRSRRYS